MPPRPNKALVRTIVTTRRCLNKHDDQTLLADALGLLSPKKSVKNTANYKPLLFRHLQKGDVTENYAEIRRELLPEVTIPKFADHTKQVNNLLSDLEAAAGRISTKSLETLEKSLLRHVLTLTSEDELIELVCLSLQQNKLTLPLLTKFILNRHLTQLERLPFNVDNLDKSMFMRNGWSQQNFHEFNVLLMKKYHDLNRPLLIIKILKNNFEAEFLPLIYIRKLLPFYERIIWKFYFEYIKQLHLDRNEQYYIKSLNDIRSTFIMWESSSENNKAIFDTALKVHKLSPLQKVFIELCVCEPVQRVITQELESGRSRLLSELKKISLKFKVSSVGTLSDADSVATRAHGYSTAHAIESFIKREFPNWAQNRNLTGFLHALAVGRAQMAHATEEFGESLVMA